MKRQIRQQWYILVVAGLIGFAASAPASTNTTTLALIPAVGDRKPAPAVLDRLEAIWLQQKEVSLVERREIEKILAEHQMTGAKLIDATSRIRLGQFVPADLLVFVDGISSLPKPATRIQVSESKSGIVLASQIFENDALLASPQAALEVVTAALAKRAVPTADRHILGYLEFRSEESGLTLDGTAAALGSLVITELARVPEIMVLEREHLQHLQTERELTKLEQDLRASVRLLEGGIRRASDTNTLAVTMLLRPMAGGEPLQTTLAVPANDVVEARNRVVEAIAGLLRTRPIEFPKVERAVEAAVFAKQGSLWLDWGDKDRAVRAAETALALDPTQENRVQLAQTLIDELIPPLEHPEVNVHHHTTLRQAIRSRQLLLDYYRVQAATFTGDATKVSLPAFFRYLAGATFTDESPGTKPLKEELRRLEDDLFRAQLDFCRTHYAQTRDAYWQVWSTRMDMLPLYYEGDSKHQLELVREAVDAFASVPDLPGPFPGARLGMLLCVANKTCDGTLQFQHLSHYRSSYLQVPPLCSDTRSREMYAGLWRELRKHKDPFLRFVGQRGLSRLLATSQPKGSSLSAYIDCERAMRRILLEEIHCDHRYRGSKPGPSVPAAAEYYHDPLFYSALECFGFVGEREEWPRAAAEEKLDDAVRLLRQVVASGQPKRVASLRGVWASFDARPAWLDYLAWHGRHKEAIDLTEAMIAMGEGYPDKFAFGYEKLLEKRAAFTKTTPAPAPSKRPVLSNGPGWEDYDIRPVHLGFDLATSSIYPRFNLFMLSDGNRLCCIRPVLRDSLVDLAVTTHWLPSGSTIGRIDVPCALPVADGLTSGGRWLKAVFAVALGPDAVYVGTHSGLVMVSLKTKEWTRLGPAEGLPGSVVRALGWLQGKLYLGFGCDPWDGKGGGDSAFASYDPQQKKYEIIATEKGVDSRNPWNGVKFQLDDIVADEPHGCVWLKDRKRGLWKFVPAGRSFEQIVPDNAVAMLPQSRYVGATEPYVANSNFGIRLFRPHDRSYIDLPSTVANEMLNTSTYVAAVDDDAVIAGACNFVTTAYHQSSASNRQLLFLLKPGKPVSLLACTPDGSPFPGALHLQETAAGIVAVTKSGEVFIIRRKAREKEYRLAELQSASGNENETKLLDAAEAGNSKAVESLLAAGVQVNTVDPRGWTPLHYAIDRKRTETALLLIRDKANLSQTTAAGCPPLSLAAAGNEVAVVKELLSRGVQVDAAAENGGTALMYAAESGATEAAALLIAAGADVNHRYSIRLHNTILMEASWRGQLEAVKLLLDHGAHLEGTDNNGNTALTCAANTGKTNVVQYLLQHGANVNAANRNAWTALMQAVEAKQLESVRMLVEAGADLDKLGPGRTALMIAARESTVEIVRCLVDHGASVSVQSGSGWTALKYAEVEKRYEIVNVLLPALEAEKKKGER